MVARSANICFHWALAAMRDVSAHGDATGRRVDMFRKSGPNWLFSAAGMPPFTCLFEKRVKYCPTPPQTWGFSEILYTKHRVCTLRLLLMAVRPTAVWTSKEACDQLTSALAEQRSYPQFSRAPTGSGGSLHLLLQLCSLAHSGHMPGTFCSRMSSSLSLARAWMTPMLSF